MRCIEPTGHLPLNNQNMKHVLTQSWKLLFCEELEDHCNAHLHRIGNHFNMICWWTFSCPNLPISWHSKHRANILYRLQFCNHPNYTYTSFEFASNDTGVAVLIFLRHGDTLLRSAKSYWATAWWINLEKHWQFSKLSQKFNNRNTVPLLAIHFQEPLRNNFSGHIDRDDCLWSFVWSHRKRSKQGQKDACGRLSQEVECHVPSVVNFYLNLEFFLFC